MPVPADFEHWAEHDALLRDCIKAGLSDREIIVQLCIARKMQADLLGKQRADYIKPFTITEDDKQFATLMGMARPPVEGYPVMGPPPGWAAAMCPACGERGQDAPHEPDIDGNNRRCVKCAYRWNASERIQALTDRGREALRLKGSKTPFKCGACDHPMAMFIRSASAPEPDHKAVRISFKMRNAVRCVKCEHLGMYLTADMFIFTRYEGPITHPSQMGDQSMTPARNRLPDDFYI